MKKNAPLTIALIAFIILLFWYMSPSIFKNDKNNKSEPLSLSSAESLDEAYFAWWCFWCVESAFEKYDWVIDSISWYAWWEEVNPSYNQVASWETWHREAVKVIYDSSKINYNDLLEIFWRQINPTDEWWQYADRWFQYTSAIFYKNESQKEAALKSKENLEKSSRYDKKIVVSIIKLTTFYEAEKYHQDYYKKNPIRYNLYASWSGRKDYLKEVWWEDFKYEIESKSDLKSRLTPIQYYVTQEDWTEKPFDNEYRNNHEQGIYVDIVDWTPLFSSQDKFDSWTGWPSFTRPINKDSIIEEKDNKLFITRTEVRAEKSDSHLWHVFSDWPSEKWWLRYCINSAALKFIHIDELDWWEYDEYKKLFE